MGCSLAVSDLLVKGDDDRTLLQVERLSLAKGEILGLRGPSGAGKSTLLYTLAGLIKPAAGSVLWDNNELTALNSKDRARFRQNSIGLIFQDAFLFEELSPRDNAALASAFAPARERRTIREKADAALSMLGLGSSSTGDVSKLSGGERQRVSIARALSRQPSILLADEPTASLDRKTADRLIEDLLGSCRATETTAVIVSHDPHLLERTDRIITIEDGQMSSGGEA